MHQGAFAGANEGGEGSGGVVADIAKLTAGREEYYTRERIAQTVTREVREETGLEVEPEYIVGVYSDPSHVFAYDDGEVRQQFSVCFACGIVGGQVETSRELRTELVAHVLKEVEHYPGRRTGGCPDLLDLLVDRRSGRMCVSGSGLTPVVDPGRVRVLRPTLWAGRLDITRHEEEAQSRASRAQAGDG